MVESSNFSAFVWNILHKTKKTFYHIILPFQRPVLFCELLISDAHIKYCRLNGGFSSLYVDLFLLLNVILCNLGLIHALHFILKAYLFFQRMYSSVAVFPDFFFFFLHL